MYFARWKEATRAGLKMVGEFDDNEWRQLKMAYSGGLQLGFSRKGLQFRVGDGMGHND